MNVLIQPRNLITTGKFRCVNVVPNPEIPGQKGRCGWIGFANKGSVCPKCGATGHMSKLIDVPPA